MVKKVNLRTLRYCLLAYCLFDWFIGYGGFVPLIEAQGAGFTVVTGTVTDPNGLPYAAGTISPILASAGTPTLAGLPYTPPTQPVGLSLTGSFVMQLGDNTQLSPGGTKWNFQVCSGAGSVQPAGGKGPVCFTLAAPITISGATQDISAQLNAVALSLTTLNAGTLHFPGAPPGGAGQCTAAQTAVNDATLALFECAPGGTWTAIAAAAGAVGFASVLTGTNTVALTVGTGGSLNTSGTGINNANQVNGGTVPLSAAFLGSNGINQPIVAVCASTQILVGNAGNLAVCQPLTGDSSITNTGVITNKAINGTLFSGLGTGILKNTTVTGVPSIAVAGDFPILNQNTSGSAASFTGNLAGDTTGPQGATITGRINGVSFGSLATGPLCNTTSTGLPFICAVGNFPTFNQNTTGSADHITGALSLANTPLTTNNDLLTVVGGVLARLPAGANGTFLGISGGVFTYAVPPGVSGQIQGFPTVGTGASTISNDQGFVFLGESAPGTDFCTRANAIFTANSAAVVDGRGYPGSTLACSVNPLANCGGNGAAGGGGQLLLPPSFILADVTWQVPKN
jgi:hypothetical protein